MTRAVFLEEKGESWLTVNRCRCLLISQNKKQRSNELTMPFREHIFLLGVSNNRNLSATFSL